MELIERTQKAATITEQKTDQKVFLTQIHMLQHSWKLSFHASNSWQTNFNAFERDFCFYKPKKKSQKRTAVLNTPECEVS